MRRVSIAWLILAAFGCDDAPEPNAPTPETVPQQVDEANEALNEATRALPENMGERACVFLTEELVRGALGVARTVEIERQVGRASCILTWERPMTDEQRQALEERRQEAMRKMMEQVRSGMRAQGLADAMQMPSETARVAMNFSSRDFESPEAAARGFDAALEMLARGVSGMVGNTDEEVTFQASHEAVEGVGDRAAWSTRMKQLTVQAGAQLFFVTVEIEPEPDANLPKAKAVAEAIVDAL